MAVSNSESIPIPVAPRPPLPPRPARPVLTPAVKEMPKPAEPEIKGPAPPVFIKIDKYSDVVRNLNRLREGMINLRDALHMLSNAEKELQANIENVYRLLDKVADSLGFLDDVLLRAFKEKPAGREDLEGYVKELYNQIEKIKSQLRTV
ncbi:MAG: hypothetical protein QW703_00235 [Candidatus Aenigmatarchaeota archaeon]